MIADSDAELHAMPDLIGVKRKWHQAPPKHDSHYDIALSKRAKAIAAGAVEITLRQCAAMSSYRRFTGLPLPKPVLAELMLSNFIKAKKRTGEGCLEMVVACPLALIAFTEDHIAPALSVLAKLHHLLVDLLRHGNWKHVRHHHPRARLHDGIVQILIPLKKRVGVNVEFDWKRSARPMYDFSRLNRLFKPFEVVEVRVDFGHFIEKHKELIKVAHQSLKFFELLRCRSLFECPVGLSVSCVGRSGIIDLGPDRYCCDPRCQQRSCSANEAARKVLVGSHSAAYPIRPFGLRDAGKAARSTVSVSMCEGQNADDHGQQQEDDQTSLKPTALHNCCHCALSWKNEAWKGGAGIVEFYGMLGS